MRSTRFACALAATLAFAACKPASTGSQAASLDNLASNAGRATDNSCHGSYGLSSQRPELNALIAKQTRYPAAVKADVEAALSAVPNGLKEMFYGFGYELEFAADARQRCAAKAGLSGTDEAPLACAFGKPVAAAAAPLASPPGGARSEGEISTERLTLVVSATPADIRHATLLAFASVLGRALPNVHFDADGPIVRPDEDEKVAANRRALAVHALHDEYAAGRDGFARFAAHLPTDAAFKARGTTYEKRLALFTAFSDAHAADAMTFEQLVLENTIDSYYCDAAITRVHARSLFPTTIQLFETTLHRDIDELADAPTGLSLYEDCDSYILPGRRYRCQNRNETGYSFPRLAGYRLDPAGSGQWVMPTAGLGWRANGDYVYASDMNNGYSNGYGYGSGYSQPYYTYGWGLH